MARHAGAGAFDLLTGSMSGGVFRPGSLRRVEAALLPGLLDKERIGTRFATLPCGATVCRTFRLPGVPPEQLKAVLTLQAESHLLGGIPRHRTAVEPLPSGTLGPEPVGLLLAWPEQSTASMPPGSGWRVVPEILCLLEGGASTGSSISFMADARDGSVGVALRGPDGPMLRATCEANDGDGSWPDTVRQALAETAMASGHEPATAKKLAEEALATSVKVDDLTLSAGNANDLKALLSALAKAAAGPLGAFCAIIETPPTVERGGLHGAVERSLRHLADPKFAMRFTAAAVLLAMAIPVAAAGLRVAILRSKLPDPEAFERSMKESEQQLAVYRELESQAWPFMKVLGDLVNCMPEAIEAESIVMGHGEPLTIRGIAKPEGSETGADAVLEMERRLRASGVFEKITKRWDPPDGRGIYAFSLTADVAKATRQARFGEGEDFAVTTLAERRYGPSARPGRTDPPPGTEGAAGEPSGNDAPSTTTVERPTRTPSRTVASAAGDSEGDPPATDARESSTTPSGSGLPDRGIGRRRPSDGDQPTSGDSGGRAVSVPGSNEAPPTINYSDAEIEAMSKAEAQAALGKVARARQSPGLDDEAKERLRAMFDRLLRRVREAS